MKQLKYYALLCALVFLLVSAVIAAPATDTTTTNSAKPNAVSENNPAPEDPVKMLRDVTNNVLHALQKRNPSDLKDVYALVDNLVLPYCDFDEMSKWVAGRTVWGKASMQTKEEFMDQFKILVVRTYATALNSYTNEKIEFGKQKLDLNKDRIQVSSTVLRQNKENIRLDYRLIKHENKWYVYDIIIEGVSILQGFQAQFSSQIRQEGLDKVIAQIKQHNREKGV